MKDERTASLALLRETASHLEWVIADSRRRLEHVRRRLRELTAPAKSEIGAHDE